MRHEIAGLGNALVDALVVLDDDDVLTQMGLVRGTMHPVDDERWRQVHARVQHLDVTLDAGGSCANAVATAGLMGADSVYCGRVGDDEMGRMYGERMVQACGQHALQVTHGRPTGKCLSMISAHDAERTMVTDLGAATTIPDLEQVLALVSEARVTHFTGYTLFDEGVRSLVEQAMARVHEVGGLVSLDCADPVVIAIDRDMIWRLVETWADLVFLNAEEASMLTGATPREAVHLIGERMRPGATVVVKLGKEGSLILTGGRLEEIDIEPVAAVDTTGAGDSYAGGYLYGYVHGWSPRQCGELASAVAARVVAQVGARIHDAQLLRSMAEAHASRR